jgi:hypothetical protein
MRKDGNALYTYRVGATLAVALALIHKPWAGAKGWVSRPYPVRELVLPVTLSLVAVAGYAFTSRFLRPDDFYWSKPVLSS